MKKLYYFVLLVIIMNNSSCKLLYPNYLFEQGDYKYFELAQKKISDYVIQPGDQLTLRVYSRNGVRLIDVINSEVTGNSQSNNTKNQILYNVDEDGYVKLPIIGSFYVRGFTELELERTLAERYSTLFIEPFIVLKVANRRAFVFKGSSGAVIPLNETPTSLIEVIALSGGIDQDLKAYKVKVLRGDLKNPQIQIIDLSTIEGLRNANLIVQSNDIVYIEQRRRWFGQALKEIAPIISAVGTVTTMIILINRF